MHSAGYRVKDYDLYIDLYPILTVLPEYWTTIILADVTCRLYWRLKKPVPRFFSSLKGNHWNHYK